MPWLSVFQQDVASWMLATFGLAVQRDKTERNYRFLEEALELAQAGGCTREDTLRLVDYVYTRPPGSVRGEIGDVMVTLAALTDAHDIVLARAADEKLAQNWERKDTIAAKAARKTIRSPLPGASS